jgi:hypothetical protein
MEKNNTLKRDDPFDNCGIPLVYAMIMCGIIIGIGLWVADDVVSSLMNNMTYLNCCNGSVCTDTYYIPKDNSCHLVLCEDNVFAKNCTYVGKNITLTIEGD